MKSKKPEDSQTLNAYERIREYQTKFSADDQKVLAHIKRFMDCGWGEPEFAKALTQGHKDLDKLRDECCQRGIEIDPKELEILWPIATLNNSDDQPCREEIAANPYGKLWLDFVSPQELDKTTLIPLGNTQHVNPQFHNWRQRQINRCKSELGERAKSLGHNILAFELSHGCSVGCPFCALAAGKLQKVLIRTKQAKKLWREMLQASVERFGQASQTGVCYWGTEPMDNPDYLDFVRDFLDITGELPQTTTALAMKNPAVTRELINMHAERFVPLRFSVLSVSMLRKIHAEFTPEELLYVNLLLYCNPKRAGLVKSGRLLENAQTARQKQQDGQTIVSGTAACMSGFLVNMVTQTVKLISPCYTTDENPFGYKVFAAGRFQTADEFAAFIDECCDELMPLHVQSDDVLTFRPDLSYQRYGHGFRVKSRFREHKYNGAPYLANVGEMLAQGYRPSRHIMENVIANQGDILATTGMIQQLYENGLIEVRQNRKAED